MFDIAAFIILCLNAVYFIMPAYIANLSGLAFGGTTPVDFGKNFIDGRRITGDGVTWRGLIFGTITGTLVGAIEGVLIWDPAYGLVIGFLLSFGALIGDAVGSFIKRRLGIGRGKPAPILDQLDFIVGALILASLYTTINSDIVIIIAVLTFIIHIISNIVAYLIGMKDVWY
jgi:CDP-2,3-bis-(O-geranylgeranyl)-sn-glycerol synthase